MTDTRSDDLQPELDQLDNEADALDRPDREIPLPHGEEDEDGVGPATGIVP